MALVQRALAEIKYPSRIYFCNPMEIIVLLIGMTASTKSPCPFEINNLPLLRPTEDIISALQDYFAPTPTKKKILAAFPNQRPPEKSLCAHRTGISSLF